MNENNRKNADHNVKQMFNKIAGKYDFLNHFLSFGIDKIWRKKLGKEIKKHKPVSVLDIATGTGDMLLLLQKKGIKITDGADPSEGMLEIAREKINKTIPENNINLYLTYAEKMKIENAVYDAAVIVFGIRNFENIDTALNEINRILKSKGRLFILEFSLPENKLIRFFYLIYLRRILPFWGRIISGDRTAYQYLAETIQQFTKTINVSEKLKNNGFKKISSIPLTFGIARIWSGEKK